MKTNDISRLIGGDQKKREKHDFYETPAYVIDYVLDNIHFEGNVWEPSCGKGAISKKLIERGYETRSSDLNDYGYGETGINFLTTKETCDNVFSNPPFNISTEYTLHALKIAKRKVVLLNKLTFLEGIKRREQLFSLKKLSEVHVYSKRLSFNDKSGMLCFAWFVFDNEYYGESMIKWI